MVICCFRSVEEGVLWYIADQYSLKLYLIKASILKGYKGSPSLSPFNAQWGMGPR